MKTIISTFTKRLQSTPLLLALALSLILPACQKCESCSYMVQDANGNLRTQPFREICGKKYERDIDREACHFMAALNGSTCVCSKN